MRRFAFVLIGLSMVAATATGQVCDIERLSNVATPGSVSHPLILGGVAYVAGDSAGIVRVDVSDPADMILLGSDPSDGPVHDLSLDYFRNLLVTAEHDSGVGTYTVDRTGADQIAVTSLGETAVTIAGAGTTEFVVGTSEGSLMTILVDGARSPVVEGSVTVGDEVVDVVLDGHTAYCALGTGNGIAIVDISDREQPALLTTHTMAGNVTSLARDGDVLYAGVAGIGLVSLQISGDTLDEVDTLALAAEPAAVVAGAERVYVVGPDLGLVVVDSSLGSDLIQIGSRTLNGSIGVAVAGAIFVGRGTEGFSSLDNSACDSGGSLVTTSYIPAGARSRGDAGTFWLTDVAIANLSDSPASINVAYLRKRQPNTDPANQSFTVAQGEQIMLEDVFESMFGLDRANGALRVTAQNPNVKTTSRTYNSEGEAGTYGQFIPALTELTAVVSGRPGALPQLQENSSFRTNVGALNLTDETLELEIHLFDGDGTLLGIKEATLRPFEMDQYDKIFADDDVGAGTVNNGYAVVRVITDGGKVLAYASVVDNLSGDPVYVQAQPVIGGGFIE
jgi:hypothetical protein